MFVKGIIKPGESFQHTVHGLACCSGDRFVWPLCLLLQCELFILWCEVEREYSKRSLEMHVTRVSIRSTFSDPYYCVPTHSPQYTAVGTCSANTWGLCRLRSPWDVFFLITFFRRNFTRSVEEVKILVLSRKLCLFTKCLSALMCL